VGIGQALAAGLDYAIFATPEGLFCSVFMLATFLPTLAVSVRRIYDSDISDWAILIDLLHRTQSACCNRAGSIYVHI
jgi:uncharacterized membrane protein YhaH (DUF805 family)